MELIITLTTWLYAMKLRSKGAKENDKSCKRIDQKTTNGNSCQSVERR